MSGRKQISKEEIDKAIIATVNKLNKRLEEKGSGSFLSTHEITGVVSEEYHELMDAQRSNNQDEYRKELMDIAVGCIFGIACIDAGGTEW